MKYVHVYTGAEKEADEGALHWPWVAPDRAEVHDRVARAREAARQEVAARVSRSGPKPAAAKVRTSRRKAAAAAAEAVSSSEAEAGTDAGGDDDGA